MVRKRGLQYSIVVKDGFSANLDILGLKLNIVQQQFIALGNSLAAFAGQSRSTRPLRQISEDVKANRKDLRNAIRDYGRFATVLKALAKQATLAKTALQGMNRAATGKGIQTAGARLNAGFTGANKNIIKTNKNLKQTETFLDRALRVGARVFAIFFAFRAFQIAASGLSTAVKQGILFNAELERSVIGIKALISSFFAAADGQGRILNAQERFVAAAKESKKQVELLRIAGLSTAATFEELQFAFQTAIGPGAAAGFSLKEIRELTILISQAATSLGLEQNQLAEEIRSLFTATGSARATKLLVLFDEGELKKAKELGTQVELITSRLEQFGRAGEESLGTFFTALVNLKSAFQQVLGKALEGFFSELVPALNQMRLLLLSINEEAGTITINEKALTVVEQLNTSLTNLVAQIKASIQALGFEGVGDAISGGLFLIEKALSLLIATFFLLVDVTSKMAKVLRPVVEALDLLADSSQELDKSLGGNGARITEAAIATASWVAALLFLRKGLNLVKTGFGLLLKFARPITALFTGLAALFTAGGPLFLGSALAVGAAAIGSLLTSLSGVLLLAGTLTSLFLSIANDILPDAIKSLEIGKRLISEWITIARDTFAQFRQDFLAGVTLIVARLIDITIGFFQKAKLLALQNILAVVEKVQSTLDFGFIKVNLDSAATLLREAILGQEEAIVKHDEAVQNLNRSIVQASNSANKEREERRKGLNQLKDTRIEMEKLAESVSDLLSEDGEFGPELESVKNASKVLAEMVIAANKLDRKLRLTGVAQEFEGLGLTLAEFTGEALAEVGDELQRLRSESDLVEEALRGTLDGILRFGETEAFVAALALGFDQLKQADDRIQVLTEAASNKARQRFIEFLQQEKTKSKASLERTEIELASEQQLFDLRKTFVDKFIPAEQAATASKLAQTISSQAQERRLLQINLLVLEASLAQETSLIGKATLEQSILNVKQRQAQVDKEIGNALKGNLLDLQETFLLVNREISKTSRDIAGETFLAQLPAQVSEIGIELAALQQDIRNTFSERRQDVTGLIAALQGAFLVVPAAFKGQLIDTFRVLQEQLSLLSEAERNAINDNLTLYASNVAARQELDNIAAKEKLNLLQQITKLESEVGFSELKKATAEYEKQRLTILAQGESLRLISQAKIADLQSTLRITDAEDAQRAILQAIFELYLDQNIALRTQAEHLADIAEAERKRKALLTSEGAEQAFFERFQDSLNDHGSVVFDLLTTLEEGIQDTLGGAIADALFRDENTLLERAQNLAEQLVQIFIEEFIKRKILANLFAALDSGTSGSGQGTGGDGGFKGGLVGPEGFSRGALHRNAHGYHLGGPARPSGLHPSDTIPAYLAKGEFVQPKSSVGFYGKAFMEAIRQRALDPVDVRRLLSTKPISLGRIPGARQAVGAALGGFHGGGLVTGPGASSSSTGANRGTQIINVFDPDQIPVALSRGPGRDVILNLIDARLASKGF